MKKLNMKTWALVALVVSGVAFAAAGTIGSIDQMARWMKGGQYVGSTASSGNFVSKSLGASLVFAFPADGGPQDSPAITVTGASIGDPCFVGAQPHVTAGIITQFGCFVSAADTVKIHQAPGTSTTASIADAGFYVRVISSQ